MPSDSTRPPEERLLFGGFAPLAVAILLALLAVVLVPSVAPEQVVIERTPATAPPLPTTPTTPTTAPAAPSTTAAP